MKRFIISFGWLVAAGVAVAGTGASNEFRLDCRTGVRTAALTEKIQYSTAWATNLTAAQQGEAKAVVKVNPCLKTPPKYLVVDMSGGRSAARWPVSYLDEVPSGGWTDEYKTEKLVLRYIPAGSFIMGGRNTDYPGAVNTNLHMVTLTKPFYIGVFECTQRQWELVMGNRPSFFTNETCWATRPVDRVSYLDIRGSVFGREWPKHMMVDDGSFLGVVRAKTGNLLFDLPTDAQWEYACRAGTTTALNSGKNLTGEMDCENMNEVARYRFNSNNDNLTQDEKANCTVQYCSAKVGSYIPNGWGLFDMHGNLWEHCIDRALALAVGSIDPTGGNDTALTKRVIRGGGYNEDAWRCRSAFRYSYTSGHGYSQTGRGSTVGFRICLHDATVYPSADSATVLINASGASAAVWTPTQAGTYQLTHEVQVDGVTVAPMESALFMVEGPELRISALGELTNGVAVKVEKVGGGGEWTVYYSLDGSEPTAGSTKYEGPFALPASATVKAVAISAGGVSSEVASKELALHPALAVEDVAARQRYPWNGKVDIDCEIAGDASRKFAVTFVVEDEIGHTNLPIRTVGADVLGGPQPQNNENALDGGSGVPGGHALPFVLSPGKYRFTWDAAADLPKGARFGGVSVSIDAEPSPMADWKRVVTISTDGYAGNETLTDVPVLVRLSSAIDGFDYADFAAPDIGADMIFTDMDGTARYPYEIDEWHKDGESLVWVKLPELKKGTQFKLAYGNAQYAIEQSNNPNNQTIATHDVWRDYAGVWHMNEDSGTAFDSTEHGLDALPDHGTNKLADVSQMVAYENGACGRARVVSSIEPQSGNSWMAYGTYYHVPSYDALTLNDKTVISCWFNGHVTRNYPRLISRKHANGDAGGFEISLNTAGTFDIRGGSSVCTAPIALPDYSHNWICLTVVFAGGTVTCFTNGVEAATFENVIDAIGDNGLPLGLGNKPDVTINPAFTGQYDEIRLRGGTLSADRIKADYDMIANRDFCTYGKVEAGPGAEPVPPSTTYRVRFNANGGTGMMADEVFEIGVAKALTANVFTRDGYTFDGWATSAGGVKVYEDKQSVSDLTTPGATVNLYAVWKGVLYMVVDLSGGSSATSYPVSYLTDVPNGGWTDAYKTSKLVLRRVPAGTNSAGGRMSKDMWVGVFEVTQKQWTLVGLGYPDGYTGSNWHYTKGDTLPIESLGYYYDQPSAFINKINSKSSLSARLPSKDEWEYACRAGTKTDLNNGTTLTVEHANVVAYWGISVNGSTAYNKYGSGTGKPTKVGSYAPNAWGLYDMHGNVDERTTHTWSDVGSSGIYAIGGSYDSNLSEIKVANEIKAQVSGLRVFADAGAK